MSCLVRTSSRTWLRCVGACSTLYGVSSSATTFCSAPRMSFLMSMRRVPGKHNFLLWLLAALVSSLLGIDFTNLLQFSLTRLFIRGFNIYSLPFQHCFPHCILSVITVFFSCVLGTMLPLFSKTFLYSLQPF